MSEIMSIPMVPVKEKLRNLKQYIPGISDEIDIFGNYLAGKLPSNASPEGFVAATLQILYDLTLYNTYCGEKITKTSTESPELVYLELENAIPRIAELLHPGDFVNEVKKVYEETKKTEKESV